MFANETIKETTTGAVIHIGASDIFILEKAAKKLNLRVKKGAGWLKIVNSKEAPTSKIARDVELHIEQWTSKETIELIPLNDYNFIVGFLDKIYALIIPFVDCICILDTCYQCAILVK